MIKGLNSKKKPLATEAAQGHPLIFTPLLYYSSAAWSTFNSSTSDKSQSNVEIKRSIVSRVKLVLLLNKEEMFVGSVSILAPNSLIDAIPFSSMISKIRYFLSRNMINPLLYYCFLGLNIGQMTTTSKINRGSKFYSLLNKTFLKIANVNDMLRFYLHSMSQIINIAHMENKLKNWMVKNRVKAITLARHTGVTRQTIAKLINNDFIQIDRHSLQKIKKATGLTYDELLSDGESGAYYRRTGIAKLDTVIENILHDMHDGTVKDRYQQYITEDFYCSSPHFLSTERVNTGEHESRAKIMTMIVEEGTQTRQDIVTKMETQGWLTWNEMCLVNTDDGTSAHNKYIVVDSIDMVGNYRRIDLSTRVQVTVRAVFWDGEYSMTHTTTILTLELDHNFGEIMGGCLWKIKSWMWYDINTDPL